MPDPVKFKNKYRTISHRLKNYDYSSNGAYFITICTRNRQHLFGDIVNGEMVLNDLGKIVADEWKKTEKIRKNITIDEFVIMPNHVHGILMVDNNYCRDVLSKRLYTGKHLQMSKISPTKNSISTTVRFFKRQTIIESRKINPNFVWQSNYHDRIIRDEDELNRIREYIIWNPQNWKKDDLYSLSM